jgi:hypothetical protein
LSIPIILILNSASEIKKELSKREKNRGYCENEIMESETVRNYINSPEYKSLAQSMLITSSLFTIIVFILLLGSLTRMPKDMNISKIYTIIILVIVFILSTILIHNSRVIQPVKNSEYINKIIEVRQQLANVKSFANLPVAFQKPFMERWLSLQNSNEILTSKDIIAAIDREFSEKSESIVGFLRPADNYFFEDKEITYKKDIEYLYDKAKLPPLNDYNDIIKFNPTVAWLLLIFLYYHIYHIYFNDVDMFVEMVITTMIILILCMLVYYITIAKDEL